MSGGSRRGAVTGASVRPEPASARDRPRADRLRRRIRPGSVLVGILLIVAWLAPDASPASAQLRLAGTDGWSLELGGYLRSITAVQDLGYELPGVDRRSAFNGEVLRLRWRLAGDGWVLDVHDRLQGRVTSADAAEGSVVGFGVSAVPGRSVDLETTLVEEDRFRVWHDLDRLALTLYTDAADVTLGRQAVTWGLSALFPVADLWSRFSPYELDTEEKPGIDAVRVLTYPAEGLEVDVVVADRGSLDDLSAGVRASLSLASSEVWAGMGKLWREAIVMLGGERILDEMKLRAEAAMPVDLRGGGGLQTPRLTAGVDWIRGDWAFTGELHLNGIGAPDPEGYVDVLSDRRVRRGETYFLGRTYAGAAASYTVTDRLSVAATALVNVEDPSATVSPAATYDFGRNARVSVGGLLSAGDEPVATAGPVPRLRSEFGTYGSLGWTTVSVYF